MWNCDISVEGSKAIPIFYYRHTNDLNTELWQCYSLNISINVLDAYLQYLIKLKVYRLNMWNYQKNNNDEISSSCLEK